jgi:hypothetical protein
MNQFHTISKIKLINFLKCCILEALTSHGFGLGLYESVVT